MVFEGSKRRKCKNVSDGGCRMRGLCGLNHETCRGTWRSRPEASRSVFQRASEAQSEGAMSDDWWRGFRCTRRNCALKGAV